MTFSRLTPGLGALAAGLLLASCKDVPNAATGVPAASSAPSAAVNPATTTDCTQATRNPAKVVCLATAFKATLSSAQLTTLQQAYTAAQQQLVKNAIEAWVKDQPTAEANALLAAYEDPAALAQTYVGSSGGRDSTKQGSYIRIDGPRVWIEFVCQNGVVFQSQIHFHTIWRDRQQDYGGDFTF